MVEAVSSVTSPFDPQMGFQDVRVASVQAAVDGGDRAAELNGSGTADLVRGAMVGIVPNNPSLDLDPVVMPAEAPSLAFVVAMQSVVDAYLSVFRPAPSEERQAENRRTERNRPLADKRAIEMTMRFQEILRQSLAKARAKQGGVPNLVRMEEGVQYNPNDAINTLAFGA